MVAQSKHFAFWGGIILILGFSNLIAQNASHPINNSISQKNVGLTGGYANTYNDGRISGHAEGRIFIEGLGFSSFRLRLQAGYFNVEKRSSWYAFQYRDKLYQAYRPRKWEDFSLGLAGVWNVHKSGYIGLGIGADYVKIEETVYDRSNPFVINNFTDEVFIVGDRREKDTLVKPSFSALAGLYTGLFKQVDFIFEIHIKLLFMGEKYGTGFFNSLNTYSLNAGFRYNL